MTKDGDIVERLHSERDQAKRNDLLVLLHEAADEIERLRKALEEIAQADVRLERDGHGFSHHIYGPSRWGYGYQGPAAPALQKIARKPLEKT